MGKLGDRRGCEGGEDRGVSDEAFNPFERLNALHRMLQQEEPARLRRLRLIAYAPADASDEEAWAHIGRYAARNYFDLMVKRPPGRPRVPQSTDLRRALKVCALFERERAATIQEAIQQLGDAGDPDFPIGNRSERALNNSVSRGLSEYEAILDRHKALMRLHEVHGDQSAKQEADAILSRLNSAFLS